MTKNQIIKMARQAGVAVKDPSYGYTDSYHFAGWEESITAFAELIAKDAYLAGVDSGIKAEREACASVAEEFIVGYETTKKYDSLVKSIATEIRARGEA